MKRIATCLAVLLLVPAVAFAASGGATLTSTSGQVVSIDAAEKMLIVHVAERDGNTHEMTFVVDDHTKIIKGGVAIGLPDLNQHDRVMVTYRVADGKNVVVNIGVESKT